MPMQNFFVCFALYFLGLLIASSITLPLASLSTKKDNVNIEKLNIIILFGIFAILTLSIILALIKQSYFISYTLGILSTISIIIFNDLQDIGYLPDNEELSHDLFMSAISSVAIILIWGFLHSNIIEYIKFKHLDVISFGIPNMLFFIYVIKDRTSEEAWYKPSLFMSLLTYLIVFLIAFFYLDEIQFHTAFIPIAFLIVCIIVKFLRKKKI